MLKRKPETSVETGQSIACLTSQPRLLGRFQASERPFLSDNKEGRWQLWDDA